MTSKELKSFIYQHKITVVKLGAPWCGPCNQVDKILDEIEEEHKNDDEKINIIRVNVDDDYDLSTFFKVRSVPTIIYMNKYGMVSKTLGLVDKKTILENIQGIKDSYNSKNK